MAEFPTRLPLSVKEFPSSFRIFVSFFFSQSSVVLESFELEEHTHTHPVERLKLVLFELEERKMMVSAPMRLAIHHGSFFYFLVVVLFFFWFRAS